MAEPTILDRCTALEHGDGISHAQKLCRRLNVTACVIAAGVVGLGMLWGYRTFVQILPYVAIGWLIEERNALQARLGQWSTARQNIDWSKVERDRQTQAGIC